MYPIIWLPFTASVFTGFTDIVAQNNGLYPLYSNDISISGGKGIDFVNGIGRCEDAIYGTHPLFDSEDMFGSTVMSFPIHNNSDTNIWRGFSITLFTTVMDQRIGGSFKRTGTFMDMSDSVNSIGLGYSADGHVYIVAQRNIYEFPSTKYGTMYKGHFSIIYDGSKLSVYCNKNLVFSESIRFSLSTDDITIKFDGSQLCPISPFNFKLYNTAITKKQLLSDYSCLLLHYKFDGSSADGSAEYTTEYDASGFCNDLTGNFIVTSTYSPSRQVSVMSSADINISTYVYYKGYVCVWIYSTDGSTGITQIDSQMSWNLTINSWHFIKIDFIHNMVGVDQYWAEVEYVDFPYVEGAGHTLTIRANTPISDFRLYCNIPTNAEMEYLRNREVHIDEKGTVYATELQEVDYMQTFGIGDRGQLMAPSFECPEYTNKKGVMDYDYIDNVLRLNNFEEM